MQAIYEKIKADPRIQANLKEGKPRPGHPEGSVGAHVAQVEGNIEKLRCFMDDSMYWRLMVLALTHDSFKNEATKGSSIEDPKSHASIATAYLRDVAGIRDYEILATCQWHDEPYALWRKAQGGKDPGARMSKLVGRIKDWDLFLAFQLADNLTEGKDPGPTEWFFDEILECGVDTRVDRLWLETVEGNRNEEKHTQAN